MSRRQGPKPQARKRIHLAAKRHERKKREMEVFVKRGLQTGDWKRW